MCINLDVAKFSYHTDPKKEGIVEGLFQPMHLIVILVIIGFVVVPWIQIFRKAGYSGWLSVLIFIPLINLATLFWFAFSRWPIEKEAERLRMGAGAPIVP